MWPLLHGNGGHGDRDGTQEMKEVGYTKRGQTDEIWGVGGGRRTRTLLVKKLKCIFHYQSQGPSLLVRRIRQSAHFVKLNCKSAKND